MKPQEIEREMPLECLNAVTHSHNSTGISTMTNDERIAAKQREMVR
jgi:hypothetical protein